MVGAAIKLVLSVQCELVSTRWSSGFEHGSQARNRPPLGQGSRAAFFVGLSIDEVAFKVEVVVDILAWTEANF